MDIRAYNREAWNTEADKKNPWTIPVGPEVIAAARRGEWHLLLTPLKPVPREWYPLPPHVISTTAGRRNPYLSSRQQSLSTTPTFPVTPRFLTAFEMTAGTCPCRCCRVALRGSTECGAGWRPLRPATHHPRAPRQSGSIPATAASPCHFDERCPPHVISTTASLSRPAPRDLLNRDSYGQDAPTVCR